MAGLRRFYIVERAGDAHWLVKRGSLRRPKIANGLLKLGGTFYALNEKRMRTYIKREFPWIRQTHYQVQIWMENNPEAVDLFSHESPDITGNEISEYAKAERLKRVMNTQMDYMVLLLILSILGNLMLAAMLYFTSQ